MKIKLSTLALVAALLAPVALHAQDAPIKREMRSAWVATVWQLDWPSIKITETGNATQIEKQKKQMTTMLDSLALNNFNAINFQVRSRSDAMYRSSYESWSEDLVATRGMDPGYDPLEFVVEECHKRGLECHAWINPYRYESVVNQWKNDPTAYRNTNPDWLIDVGTASILNPGKPEVTQRICDVISEIVTNYDIDGVLFDDYFYLSGTKLTHDGEQYNAYTAAGGTLGEADWRRENVNNMIASVYRTIKGIKPWVRFGVSPAGIACTSASVASKYGIPKCPTGSDWQYNDISSEPIAWVSRQSLDFISPQIYWTTSYSTNYTVACEWWSMVANKWNRHLYVSHSISSLDLSSKAPERSTVEENLVPLASGTGNNTYAEFAKQIRQNREFDKNGAPGSIFYSAKYLYKQSPKFSHYLKNNVFTTKALVPELSWQSAPAQGLVENLTRNGSTLSWTPVEGMRYTVYGFPESMPAANFLKEPEYLLGICYDSEFTLPAGQLAGLQYAVCILDRYGYEYSPALLGVPAEALAAPVATSPLNGNLIEVPFDFNWTAIEGASEYIVEIAYDEAMTQRVDQRSTTTNSISTESFNVFPVGAPLYWRVRSCGAGKADGVSAINSFQPVNMLILAPASGTDEMELTPTFVPSIDDREYTLEIATTEAFNADDYVYTTTGKGSITVPSQILQSATVYYARMRYMRAGLEKTTSIVTFKTKEIEASVPTVAYPAAGGVFHSNGHVTFNPIPGVSILRVEIAASADFPSRTRYATTKVDVHSLEDPKEASEIKLGSAYLVDGQTYYLRTQSTFRKLDGTVATSEFSPVQTFVYSSEVGITAPEIAEEFLSIEGKVLSVKADLTNIELFDLSGRMIDVIATQAKAGDTFTLSHTGVYILKATTADNTISIKVVL